MLEAKHLLNGRKIGICAHSYEGGALCFLEACKDGSSHLGPHMHPSIILSAIPMGLSMPGWESGDHTSVAKFLRQGVEQTARAGADFFVCPDNTAHIVLEKIIDTLPIPGLHIADIVCHEIVSAGWERVGLLGTKWTMTGPVYEHALQVNKLVRMLPDEALRNRINHAIFDELCQGIFKPETTDLFLYAIEILKQQGAQCVILGCTEIPLIVNAENSPLPILNTTKLLAKYAVKLALSEDVIPANGWIKSI